MLVGVSHALAQSTVLPAAPKAAEEVVRKLSPFEVVADTKGYFSANTVSGTRLNSKLEDIGASISVVTKQQMEDLGLLDVNDVFSYESNTEGTGNFTDFSFNSSGMPMDNVQSNPQGANRVRGLGAANTNFGMFETSGRTPLDPINIDGVEISRGPNSSIFGVGSPAGAINSVPASANLRTSSSTVTARADSFSGWRTSLDLNRVLKRDVLAARISAARQRDGFALKPAGVATERLNGMFRFRPWREHDHHGFVFLLPRERQSTQLARAARWHQRLRINAGAPTWDPLTGTVKINGNVVGTYAGSTNSPLFTTQIGTVLGYIDQSGLSLLGQARGSAGTTPLTQSQTQRLVTPVVDPSGFLATQPLFQKYPVLANKAIYDWSRFNLAAMNRFEDTRRRLRRR
jgi:outer membrane receptor protein involved in Fe transport